MKVAIIGGSGVKEPEGLNDVVTLDVQTRYGASTMITGRYMGHDVVFLPRHGKAQSVPAHKINYRANIMSLKQLSVDCILATSAVGSLNKDMKPGDMAVLDQFIDFTKGRSYTFFDGQDGRAVYTDVTEPYCADLRKRILSSGRSLDISMHPKACYVCTEGPRFETPAEIRMFQYIGGDLVGMTNVPEVTLAREAGICYAAVATVTNWAAGISSTHLTHEEVLQVVAANVENVWKVVFRVIEILEPDRACDCCGEPNPVEV